MIYELRVYRVVQGRIAALLTRFEHQTLPIMIRHCIPYGPETGSACIRAGFSPRGSNAGDNELTRCREPWIRSDSC